MPVCRIPMHAVVASASDDYAEVTLHDGMKRGQTA